jgi:hypothetical protein
VKAELENPCDGDGNVVACERCGATARHRRQTRTRALRGVSWLMTRSGPVLPLALDQNEILCEECIKSTGALRTGPEELDVLGAEADWL